MFEDCITESSTQSADSFSVEKQNAEFVARRSEDSKPDKPRVDGCLVPSIISYPAPESSTNDYLAAESQLTQEINSVSVSSEKRKPELGGSGDESAKNGQIVLPIIADSYLPARENILSCGEAAMVYKTDTYIRPPRSLMDDCRFRDALLEHQIIFIRFIHLAAYVPFEHNIKGEIVQIRVGQLCYSLRKLAELCGKKCTLGLIRGAIRYFEKVDFLTQTLTHEKTIISITHRETYGLLNEWYNTRSNTELTQTSHTNREERELRELKNGKKREEKKPASSPKPARTRVATEDGLRRATFLFESIRKRKSDFAAKDLNGWAVEFDRLQRLDGVDWERIDAVLAWLRTNDFWWRNVLSGAKFRKQFERLDIELTASSEDKTVQEHRMICIEAKREYPQQFKYMQINRDNVVNLQNQKDVPFRVEASKFKELMTHVFQIDFE
jgi:hypothetical protein